jgi:hypothetical protein
MISNDADVTEEHITSILLTYGFSTEQQNSSIDASHIFRVTLLYNKIHDTGFERILSYSSSVFVDSD